jgi:hypothetical protein
MFRFDPALGRARPTTSRPVPRLAVRKWAEDEKLSSFTINYLAAGSPGAAVMPFVSAEKHGKGAPLCG